MTLSLSIESAPPQDTTPASRGPGAVEAFDLAGLAGDAMARAADDGRRRVLACPGVPADAPAALCVAAWHAVLHWLGYRDEPVTTGLTGHRPHAAWPVATQAGAETSLAELRAAVEAQWPRDGETWPDLRDPAHAGLLDALRCQTVRLEPGFDAGTPELALLRGADGGWRLACAASRYGEAYQHALLALWTRFVDAMATRPAAALSDPALAEGLGGGVMAGPSLPLAGSLLQRFDDAVRDVPQRTAVVDAEGRVAYAELGALAAAWAEALRDAGVQPGEHVGLAFGRSAGHRMVAAQLAVLKAGAAFVPVDATQPAARLQSIADDTDMRFALADSEACTPLQQALPGVRCVDAEALPRHATAPSPSPAPALSTTAYVIFTSGSTGLPKGVKVGHGNLLNFVEHFGTMARDGEIASQFAPFTFDASVAEIHASLLNRCTLVILDGAVINDPQRLQAHMTAEGVSFASFPPQYAQHLSPEALPTLRTLLTAGSAPDHALIARWQPRLRYINAYGPTETTILSTAWQPETVPAPHEPIVIGTPIRNTVVRVANRFSQPLPHGVIGELLIGGEGVAHGYLKRDEMTRERFLQMDGLRWYRSGDLASLDADGRLVFAGRVDSQIKLRGHRLEPGEVEAALVSIDGLRQAAVALAGQGAARQLVAFCVGERLDEAGIRERLLQRLPAWALPNRFVWIDALPLTRNGKTDYRRLLEDLARAADAESAPEAAVAYADTLEAQVAAVWGEVLQKRHVQPDDHFIHLGGDSLTALVVAAAVRRLGYALPASALLQHPRLADYVQRLRAQGRVAVADDHDEWQGRAALAPIQGWFFSLGLANPGRFCQSLVFDSDERIDAARLAHACQALAGHHDGLRTRFEAGADSVWQQVVDAGPIALPAVAEVEIADGLVDATSEAYARRLADELRLDAAPLFRLALVHAPGRSRVVWVLHHLVVDTVSHGLLLDDLQQLYQAAEPVAARLLPGKSRAFGAWADALQRQVDADPAAALAPWQPILDAVSAAPALLLSAAHDEGAPEVVCEARLGSAETRRLVEQATRCYRQTPEELVLAATCRALAQAFGLGRVAVDIEWHGRDEAAGVERTVGWFTSVHPLAVDVRPGEALGPWLMALKEARAAVPQRGRAFYALRYGSRDPQVRAAFDAYRAPQVLFNFSGVVQRRADGWRTVPVGVLETGEGNANPYRLSVETELRDGELVIACHSRAALWPDGAARRLGDALVQALHDTVAHCSQAAHRRWTPSDFPLLAPTQAQADTLPADTVAAFPLTDLQQTMARHPETYQVVMAHRLPRRFDAGRWIRAVEEWIARHDCLRSFVKTLDDGSACQVVLASLAAPVEVHRAEAGELQSLADELVARARRAPVAIDRAPLFALQAVHDGGDAFVTVLSIHHLIHDGWSIELLLGDLFDTYRRLGGEAVARATTPLASLADVVALQRRQQADPALQAHWAALPWQAGAAALPVTARDGGEAAQRDMRLHLGRLDDTLVAQVRARAHALGVTVNGLWLAGYAALLRLLGGSAQLRCGVIQSGRSDEIAGIETLTGCCVNTLPLVLQMPAGQTLGETAAQVEAQLAAMRGAAQYPLSAIHAAVRGRADGALFDTLFNIESHRYGQAAGGDRPVLVGGFEATNHELIFGLIEEAGEEAGALRYTLRIGFDAARHDPASVAGWVPLYAHLMGLVATAADTPWDTLPLLPAPLHLQLVVGRNRTEHRYRDDACIHELVAEQAARTPDATALVFEGQALSYRALDDRANRLARHLQALGVGPERVVGCCFERSVEMVVALLGVLKAGGAYVPLDPELPAPRIAGMVDDIGTTLVLTHGALPQGPLAALPGAVRLVRLDADAAAIDARSSAAVVSGNCPGDLAYVIFTSGSTGKPKAAMNEHGALVNRIQWQQHAYPIGPADRVLQKTPFSFDVSVWEFFWPLVTGATLVVARPGGHRDPAYLGALIREAGITTLHFVPSMLEAFVASGELAGCSSLRNVITSGEALPGTLAARFLAQSAAKLHNLYGPTEAAIDVSHYTVARASAGTEPIGRPIWNTRLYVLDERLRPVPEGVCGELYIGGLAVGRGYLGRPELTAERFIASPFVAGERLYRTGDLARWRTDGEIEYLGRTDHQVKIRGLRIELGEIEHAIASHPAVRQAVVAVHEAGGRKQLVGYVLRRTAGEDADALVAALQAALAATLPDYMVPAAFVVLDSLPLNANGKVDRARLPAPAIADDVPVVAPQTAAERTLLAIWQQVLGIERIGVTDGFFALGGDSIVAIQVASRATQQGLPLQPRHVIEDKTIRRLAARVAPAAAEPAAAAAPAREVDAALAGLEADRLAALRAAHPALQSVYPCTGMQQSMLLHSARAPQDGMYVSQLQVSLDAVDPARLRAAWQALVARHAVLRTAFADAGGERLLQLVMAEVALPWREVDLRGDAASLAALLDDERRRPFDTAAAPLMRLLLARTGETAWVLAWTYHHALIDGWSMATLMKQLAEAYGAPEAAATPAPGPDFRAYIEWLAAQDGAQAAAYWRRHFEGVAAGAAAQLPTELLRPTAAEAAAARDGQRVVSHLVPAELSARLTRLARGEGWGLGTVMLGAWGLLMAKLNAEPQVLFGYTTSGRPHALPGIEHTAGLFINSLPICLAIDGTQTLGDFLGGVQRVQLDHDEHGFLPLADIQRAVGVSPAQPLFGSLVVVENFPLDRAALAGTGAGGLRVTDVQGTGRDNVGLTLVVYPGAQLKLDLVYQAREVGDAAARTMVERLGRLLAGFAAGAAQPLAALSLLSDDERARMLGAWNNTRRAYPSNAPITARFDAQVVARGACTALVAGDERVSYERLAQRSQAIAGWLHAHGVRRGDRVALSLDKGPALIAAMLGILRCGAAYVPVAVDAPAERRAFITADAGIRHVVTRAAFAAQVAVAGVATLLLDEAADAPAGAAADVDGPRADDTAYLIYTSGTTGTPKGVAVSHRNLVNFCAWCGDIGLFGAGDRATQFAPYTFDASAGEIFATLTTGAELHLLADAVIQDPRAFTRYVVEHGIRFAALPPSYAQHIDPAAVPATLSLLTAGSAPTPELVQRWGAQRRYLNAYGPTETTILSSAWVCEPGTIDGRGLSIGRPIANTRMYVVDRLGQLCAPGLVGEIWIGGDGVAQGYVNRPELTAQQFIADPFQPGGRVYRTGDLGRWRDDGCIEFVGRRDRQVKLRGFRIELGEIEARLRAHPALAEAVVAVRGDGEQQRLLAWVVAEAGAAADAAALRAFLRETLPDYMLPQSITVLDRLPLTVNGKIDEKALPLPEAGPAAGAAALTTTEARIAAVWAAVLRIDAAAIGPQSHFFGLGGHSLLAMRVASRLLDEHGLEVGVAELFAHPVLGDLAARLEARAPSVLPPIEAAPRDRALPLSFAQRRLWFLDQIDGAGQAYLVPGVLRLRGALDEAALRAALQRLVARHETLRTTFAAVDGEPVQCIAAADTPFALATHDVSGQPAPEAAMDALIAQALAAPFDLARGPLVRGTLVRVAADDHVLLIAMHHIATDGWSLGVLMQELAALYAAFATGAADPLPPLALQYADYACWQRQWQDGPLWQAQCAHWQQVLADAPPLLDLPTDRPRPAQQRYDGATLELHFDAATRDGLVALGQRHGTTLFMSFLAAWAVVLSRLSGQQDLVVGTPVANRARLETEPMIGFFVNLLALRLDLSGEPTFAQLLQRVRERVLDGQAHQQLPFEQVVDVVQPPRCLAHTPLFQVMLNWNERSLDGFALHGLRTEAPRPEAGQSKYDITLDLQEAGDGIVGVFEYATALFDADTMRRHAGYLRRVVAAMLADTEQPLSALELIGDDEARLLASFNATDRPELAAHCWQTLFDAQAARTPARTALRCGAVSLSYAELQRRATERAARLAACGAGPGEVVALIDERGIELLVSVVALLKTGAAFLPLDPAHPPARWAEMLGQAQPRLLWAGAGQTAAAGWLRAHWQADRVIDAAALDAVVAEPFVAQRAPAPDDLAYVLFTSGSTGLPKGVQIEQRGMVNNMLSKVEPLGLTADDVIAQTASQCFDISVWQSLGALLLGARVLIVPDEVTRDPQALLALLAAERVTVWEPVPSVMQAALDTPRALPALRWVMPTGEALPRELAARWFAQYPAIPLMNAYGPAECSDDVAMQPITAAVERVMIGRPVPNARLHVVDAHLRRVPLGAVGELAVSGLVVGRGYAGRPAETAAAFRANPFAAGPGDERLYLTGDLARRWPDGRLEYVGRKDFQVKLRGFRIELGEVESCLAGHPAVREAVAALHTRGGEPQLVAWVVAPEGTPRASLDQHLAARLPDYMRPAAIVRLDTLPLNANGKVDRRRLPAPGEADLLRAAYEAPRSDTERALAGVWQSLLQLPQVGRDDCFFDLGGSSLMLVRMLAQLKALGFELALAEVYQCRTLAACAAAIDARRGGAAGWPLGADWQHRVVALGDGRHALLLARAEQARHATLQALLAALPAAERPRFVRYADDLDALVRRIHAHGAAALAGNGDAAPRHDPLRALRHASKARVQALERAPVEAALACSPIQRSFAAWQQRDGLDCVALSGWYGADELQRAFGAVAAEQDLLRAVPAAEPTQWCLLDAAAVAAAPVPVIDLRAMPLEEHDAQLHRLGDELMALRRRSALPCAPAIVSLGDLDHRVLIAVDHLVWDAMSAEVLRQRLQRRLAGDAAAPRLRYRDLVAAAWRAPTEAAARALAATVDRDALVDAVAATQRVLATRATQPLRVVQARLPLVADAGTPAEQAFAALRRALPRLTGLDRHGVLLNHHGRHGAASFDVVGPCLDKLPVVVDDDTRLAPLLGRFAELQALGLNFLGLAQTPGSGWAGVLPSLADEVLFNFLGELPPPSAGSDEGMLMDKLKDFRGVLFEAGADGDALAMHCVFRGSAAQADGVRAALGGEAVAAAPASAPAAAAVARPATPGLSLELHDVRKRYGDVEAVRGVSFSVREGGCFGILGPNGAGKTTLLAMIEGLVPATSGSIRVLGMDVATDIARIQPRLGVQLQQNNYFQFLTVAELLRFYQDLRAAVGGKRAPRPVQPLLERLNLLDKLGAKVDELSGGQKQRLSIAIALLEDPDIVFLDEPTSALDPHSRIATWEFIEDLKRDPRKTIILTTHYMEEAERLCDEILLMDKGRVIAQGGPAQLIQQLAARQTLHFEFGRGVLPPALLQTLAQAHETEWDPRAGRLTLTTAHVTDATREVLALSQAEGLALVNIEIKRPTLEQVFLSRTGKELV